MSDSHATETSAEPLFTVAEVEQLTNDDAIAGRTIGKMLAVLFLYTIVAMIIVTSWTYWSVFTDHGASAGTQAVETSDH